MLSLSLGVRSLAGRARARVSLDSPLCCPSSLLTWSPTGGPLGSVWNPPASSTKQVCSPRKFIFSLSTRQIIAGNEHSIFFRCPGSSFSSPQKSKCLHSRSTALWGLLDGPPVIIMALGEHTYFSLAVLARESSARAPIFSAPFSKALPSTAVDERATNSLRVRREAPVRMKESQELLKRHSIPIHHESGFQFRVEVAGHACDSHSACTPI